MPSLPQYESQAQVGTVSTGTRGIQTPDITGEVVTKIGQHVSEAAAKWKQAEDTMDYTQSSTTFDVGSNDMLSRAESDADLTALGKYLAESASLTAQSKEGFDNPQLAQTAGLELDAKQTGLDVKLRAIFQKKQVQFNKLELEKGIKAQEKQYLTATPEQRANIQNNALVKIEASADAGLITPTQYTNKINQIEMWDYGRGLNDATKNSQAVLDNLDSYNIPADKKGDFVEDIGKIGIANREKADVNQQIKYANNQTVLFKELEAPVTGDNYITELNNMQQQLGVDDIDQATYDTSIKKLNYKYSGQKIVSSYGADMAKILRIMGDLQTPIDEDAEVSEGKQYLRDVRELKNELSNLVSARKITENDEKRLTEQIDTAVNKANLLPRATEIASEEGGFWGFKDYTLANANIDFEKNLDSQIFKDEALREYFEWLDTKPKNGEGISTTDRKAKVTDIIVGYNKKQQKINIEKEKKANKETPKTVGGYKIRVKK